MNPSIIWFRQDRRIEDNPALLAAAEKKAPIIPVFIWHPEEEDEWPTGGASRWWLHHSLKRLQEELKNIGLHLVIRTGNSRQKILQLVKEVKADAVFWNRRYEPWARKIEAEVRSELHTSGVQAESFNGSLLFEPTAIASKEGKPYQVFTPFWKQCLHQGEPSKPLGRVQNPCQYRTKLETLSVEELGLLPKIKWYSGMQVAWNPGEGGARDRLDGFLKCAVKTYKSDRDRPDLEGVSRMSPYLHHGEISARTIWHEVRKQFKQGDENADAFLRQLGWREFAHHLLYHFPTTIDTPLRSKFKDFPWTNDKVALKAWQKGKTGFPIIDAGMRELWTSGWMHNRVRLLVGSFLVKDLLLPWQEGEKWFWDTLVDADMANNTMGWQWIAGCGADAAPYFRIFNPVSQGEKFDPEGVYVRRWVPELEDLSSEWIHKPWEAPESELKKSSIKLGKTYPWPIVDHIEARKMALKAYHELGN